MQTIPRQVFLEVMMLLEMGWQGLNPEYGSAEDYALAAHSLLQASSGAPVSWEGAETMLARIKADAEDGVERPVRPSEPSGRKVNIAQAKTIFSLAHIGGWGGTGAIENHGGNMSSASKLATDGLIDRRRIVAKSGFDTFEYRVNDAGHDALISFLSRTGLVLLDPSNEPSEFHSASD
jgi:hypothetical protein